jgi:hypothetical protein
MPTARALMGKDKADFDLVAYHQEHLAPLVLKASSILRLTEWHDQPPPVLVVKERRELLEDPAAKKQLNLPGPTKKILVEVGFLAGEAQRRLLHDTAPDCGQGPGPDGHPLGTPALPHQRGPSPAA